MSITIAILPSWTLFAWSDDMGIETLRIGPLVISRRYADADVIELELDLDDEQPSARRETASGEGLDARAYAAILRHAGLDDARARVGAIMAAGAGELGVTYTSLHVRQYVTYLRKLSDTHVATFLAKNGGVA